MEKHELVDENGNKTGKNHRSFGLSSTGIYFTMIRNRYKGLSCLQMELSLFYGAHAGKEWM